MACCCPEILSWEGERRRAVEDGEEFEGMCIIKSHRGTLPAQERQQNLQPTRAEEAPTAGNRVAKLLSEPRAPLASNHLILAFVTLLTGSCFATRQPSLR